MPKVLVVDDSVSVRKVVERALAGRQVEVVCAASGGEALDCMERDAPDVIVCDVVMPDRDGYEICEFVKKHPRLGSIPVILMSGIVNDEVRQRAARARSEGVLSKPFAAEDLVKRLDRFLGPLPLKTDAAAPQAPTATPTSMPVSTLTVEPMPTSVTAEATIAAAIKPELTIKPEPLIKSEPAVKPEPSIKLEPTIRSEPSINLEPLVKPQPSWRAEPALTLDPVKPERTIASEPVLKLEPPMASMSAAPKPAFASPAAAPTDGAAAVLAQFAAMDGVQWAVLADREGFLVEATANAGVDADVAAALSACLAESSDGLGRELGRGTLHGIILEYEKGMVVIYGAGPAGLLAVGLTESSVLGKVRYFAKKALPELTRAL